MNFLVLRSMNQNPCELKSSGIKQTCTNSYRIFASDLFKFPHLFPRPNRFVRARWVSKSKVGSLVASEVSSHAATPFRSNARCKKGQLVNRSWPNHMLQSPPWHLPVWMRKPAWYVFANKSALKFKPYEGAMNEIEWTPGPSLLYWFSRVAGFLLPKRLFSTLLCSMTIW